MIPLKVNGQSKSIPQGWEEVTFGEFLQLIGKTKLEGLAFFLDMQPDQLQKAKIMGLEFCMQTLNFLDKTPAIDPQPIKLGSFTFPKDITFETVEQYQDTLSMVKKAQEEPDLAKQTAYLANYAAIYCQVPYDSDRAQILSESFHSYPCLEVMAAGSFFMAKSLSMQTGLSMSYLRQNTVLKKSKRGFLNWVGSLGSTPLWTRWRAMWGVLTKKS